MNALSDQGFKARKQFLTGLLEKGMTEKEINDLMNNDSCRSFVNAFCEQCKEVL